VSGVDPGGRAESGVALVARIQAALAEDDVAGWLFFDFHGTNPIARRILGVGAQPGAGKTTRRWFYLVPRSGEAVKLVHRIEPHVLDHLPGRAMVYLTWEDLDRGIANLARPILGAGSRHTGAAAAVAMEYSPSACLPYVSRVDAGTVERIRATGLQVVSSADLAQRFDGVLDPEARRDHRRTGAALHGLFGAAFALVRDRVRAGARMTETGLQRWFLERIEEAGLASADPPAVAVNEHSGDPHFETDPSRDAPIGEGDFLLIDAWAKARHPGAIYADYTQVAWVGRNVPQPHAAVFDAVRGARDAAVACVRDALRSGRVVRGCEVDDAARAIIRARGYGERFLHRTGHSIGEEVHGNGVHLDNLETRDERRLLDGTLVSVEPGIYLDAFGVRSEINLLVDGGEAVVTTEPVQTEIPALLA
jgi:Xaa-Pro aminopeptidase